MWAYALATGDQEGLLASIRVLALVGPGLGRPLVDSVKGSRHKNMKELRPPSGSSSELRVLFAFDPVRRAILLVGGDKSKSWSKWYVQNVPIADARYDAHLVVSADSEVAQTTPRRRRKRKGSR